MEYKIIIYFKLRSKSLSRRMGKILNRSVCIIGPQSTGKTTLVNALVNRLSGDIPVIREVARTVMQNKGYTREDVDSGDPLRRFAMQRDIFDAQIELEKELLNSGKAFISDRCAIDPLVYLTHFAGGDGESQELIASNEWRQAQARYANKAKFLIVLLLPVPQFLVDDEIRYVAKSLTDWYSLAHSFREFVNARRIPVMEIGPECVGIEERVDLVLKELGAAGNNPLREIWTEWSSRLSRILLNLKR